MGDVLQGDYSSMAGFGSQQGRQGQVTAGVTSARYYTDPNTGKTVEEPGRYVVANTVKQAQEAAKAANPTVNPKTGQTEFTSQASYGFEYGFRRAAGGFGYPSVGIPGPQEVYTSTTPRGATTAPVKTVYAYPSDSAQAAVSRGNAGAQVEKPGPREQTIPYVPGKQTTTNIEQQKLYPTPYQRYANAPTFGEGRVIQKTPTEYQPGQAFAESITTGWVGRGLSRQSQLLSYWARNAPEPIQQGISWLGNREMSLARAGAGFAGSTIEDPLGTPGRLIQGTLALPGELISLTQRGAKGERITGELADLGISAYYTQKSLGAAGKVVSPITRGLNPLEFGSARIPIGEGKYKTVYLGVGYRGFELPSLSTKTASALKEVTGLPFQRLTNLPKRQVTPSPLIGVTETGKPVIGTPSPETMPSLAKYSPAEYSLARLKTPPAPHGGIETAILTEPSVMQASGFSPKESKLTQQFLREAELLKSVKAQAIGKYPIEFKTARPEVVSLTLDYLKQYGETGTKELTIGGSVSQVAQSTGGRIRQVGDIEPYFNEGVTRERGAAIVGGLAKKIREAGFGGEIEYVEGKTKILGKTKEGGLDHFIDAQFPEPAPNEPGSGVSGNKVYGLEFNRPKVVKEGLALMPLAEQYARKGTSSLSRYQYEGKNFLSPNPKRFKDIADKAIVAEELIAQGRKASPRVVRAPALKELREIGMQFREYEFPGELAEKAGGREASTKVASTLEEYDVNIKAFEQARIEKYAATHKIAAFNVGGQRYVTLPIRVRMASKEGTGFVPVASKSVKYSLSEPELYSALKVKQTPAEFEKYPGLPAAKSKLAQEDYYSNQKYAPENYPYAGKPTYANYAQPLSSSPSTSYPSSNYAPSGYSALSGSPSYLFSRGSGYFSGSGYGGGYGGGGYGGGSTNYGPPYIPPVIPPYSQPPVSPPSIAPPTRPPILNYKTGNENPRTLRSVRGFAVFGRKAGKFEKISNRRLTREEAIGLGERFAKTTTAATFAIQQEGFMQENQPRATLPQYQREFYKPKTIQRPGAEVFTQKRGTRIGTQGEKRGLAVARKLKQRFL